MIRRLKSWLGPMATVVVAIAAFWFHYKQRDTYRCQTCFAKKDIFQWRVGCWSQLSVPLSPRSEQISETRFLQDFFTRDHLHAWLYAQGSPYYFFGTRWGGCAIGPGRHVSTLCQVYETSPEFRAFIGGQLRAGMVTKANLAAIISLPRSDDQPQLHKEADRLLKLFFGE